MCISDFTARILTAPRSGVNAPGAACRRLQGDVLPPRRERMGAPPPVRWRFGRSGGRIAVRGWPFRSGRLHGPSRGPASHQPRDAGAEDEEGRSRWPRHGARLASRCGHRNGEPTRSGGFAGAGRLCYDKGAAVLHRVTASSIGLWRSLVARLNGVQEAGGSNPPSPTSWTGERGASRVPFRVSGAPHPGRATRAARPP